MSLLSKIGCDGKFGTDENGHIELSNGWTVSIQGKRTGIHAGDNTYEIWAWKGSNENFEPNPRGWQNESEVYAYINEVAAK